jgi:hypothetical protein
MEEILDSWMHHGKLQYLVKCYGYLKEESTWEPESNFENAQDEIKNFHGKHPAAPRRI